MTPIRDLDALPRGLEPVLHDGIQVFVAPGPEVEVEIPPQDVVAFVREPESPSFIGAEPVARRHGLEAVGLTAAVSATRAHEGIACNGVAGARPHHLFLSVDRADNAMAALRRLQDGTR